MSVENRLTVSHVSHLSHYTVSDETDTYMKYN